VNIELTTNPFKEMAGAASTTLQHFHRPRPVLYAYTFALLVFSMGLSSFPEQNLNAATAAGVSLDQQQTALDLRHDN